MNISTKGLAIAVHNCCYHTKMRVDIAINACHRRPAGEMDLLLGAKFQDLQVVNIQSKGYRCADQAQTTFVYDTLNLEDIFKLYMNGVNDFVEKSSEGKHYLSSLVDKFKMKIERFTKITLSSVNLEISCTRALIDMEGDVVEVHQVDVITTFDEIRLSIHDLRITCGDFDLRIDDSQHPALISSLRRWDAFRVKLHGPVHVNVASKHLDLVVRCTSINIEGSSLDSNMTIEMKAFRILVASNLVFCVDSECIVLRIVCRESIASTSQLNFISRLYKCVACSVKFTDTCFNISALTGKSSLCLRMSAGDVNKAFNDLSIQSHISCKLYYFDGISHGWEVIWTDMVVNLFVAYEHKRSHRVEINIEFFDTISLNVSNRTLCGLWYMLGSINLPMQSRKAADNNKLYWHCVWIQNQTMHVMEFCYKDDQSCKEHLCPNETKQLSHIWEHYDHLIRGPSSNISHDLIQLRIADEDLGIVNLRSPFCSYIVQTTFDSVVVDVIKRPNPNSLLEGILIRVRSPVHIKNNSTVELYLTSIEGAKVEWKRVLKSKQRLYLPSCKEAICLNGEQIKCLNETAYALAKDRSEIIQIGCHSIRVNMICQKCPIYIEVVLSDPFTITNELKLPLYYTLIGPNFKHVNHVNGNSTKTTPQYGPITEILFYTESASSERNEDIACCRLNLENYAKGERPLIISMADAYVPIIAVFDNSIKNGLSISLYPRAVLRCLCRSEIHFKFVNLRFEDESKATNIPDVWYRKSNADNVDDIVFPYNATVYARMPGFNTYSLVDLSAPYTEIRVDRNRVISLAISASTSPCRNYMIWCIRDLFCFVNRSRLDLKVCMQSNKWERILRKSTVHPQWIYPFQSKSDAPVTLKLRVCTLGKLLDPVSEIAIDRKAINVSFVEAREGKVQHFLQVKSQLHSNQTNQIEVIVEDSLAPYLFVNNTAVSLKVRQEANYPWTVVSGNDTRPYAISGITSKLFPCVQLSAATDQQTDPVFVDLENFTKTTIKHPNSFSIRKGSLALTVCLPTNNSVTHPSLRMIEYSASGSQHWYLEGDRILNVKCAELGYIRVLDVEVNLDCSEPSDSYKLVLLELNENRLLIQSWRFVDVSGHELGWSGKLGEGYVVNQHMKNIGLWLDGDEPRVDSVNSLVALVWSSYFSGDLVLSKRYKNEIQVFDVDYLDNVDDHHLTTQIAVSIRSINFSLVYRAANMLACDVALVTIDEICARINCAFETRDRFKCTSQSLSVSAKSLQVLDQSSPENAVISFADASENRKRLKRSIFASALTSGSMNWIDRLHINVAPMTFWIDESFALAVIRFCLDSIPCEGIPSTKASVLQESHLGNHIRIRNLLINPIQARITVRGRTSSNLPLHLTGLKSLLNIPSMSNLVNISDASLKLDTFNLKKLVGSDQIASNVCKKLMQTYYSSIRSQLIYVLGSFDFIGNPMRLAGSVKSGLVQFLISGDSSVLVGGISHGLADATCKITECLSDSFRKPDRHVLNMTSHAKTPAATDDSMLRSVFRAAVSGVSGQVAGALNIVQDIAQVVKDETRITTKVQTVQCPKRRPPHRCFFINANTPYCLTSSYLTDDDIKSQVDAHLEQHEVMINAFSRWNKYFHNSEVQKIIITGERIIVIKATSDSSPKAQSFEMHSISDISAQGSTLIVSVKADRTRETSFNFKCVDEGVCILACQNLKHCMDYALNRFRYEDFFEE